MDEIEIDEAMVRAVVKLAGTRPGLTQLVLRGADGAAVGAIVVVRGRDTGRYVAALDAIYGAGSVNEGPPASTATGMGREGV